MKKYFNRIFIDGLSGMAYGLFSTLIIGTILCQIAKLIGNNAVADYINTIGSVAKTFTGAGIGVGVACKLKASPITTVSAAVCGMIGAFPNLSANTYYIANQQAFNDLLNSSVTPDLVKETFAPTPIYLLGTPGEPLGAFIAALVAIEIGAIVSGKTKVDIIVTPVACILSGAMAGYFVGPYISSAMTWLGQLVNVNVDKHPFLGGIAVAVLMGIILTLPISSAAIGLSMKIGGLAAGAATVGCCCHMVGYAVISYRENKFGGLVAQGLGTSMIQIPNLVKKPILWLPPIISSAILGPVSSGLFKMVSNPVGSGMGSAGLVGQFMAYDSMIAADFTPAVALLEILLMHFVLPAALTLAVAEGMRKMGLIKHNDLKLESSHA